MAALWESGRGIQEGSLEAGGGFRGLDLESKWFVSTLRWTVLPNQGLCE